MTLADLARFAGTTVAQVVEAAYSGRTSSPSPKSSTKASAPNASTAVTKKPGKVARGGLGGDQILAALRAVGASAKLEDVRAKTGGTVPQVRAALQKLAASKKVSITGQRRGTRYTAR